LRRYLGFKTNDFYDSSVLSIAKGDALVRLYHQDEYNREVMGSAIVHKPSVVNEYSIHKCFTIPDDPELEEEELNDQDFENMKYAGKFLRGQSNNSRSATAKR
jgi:hypothetical protein